MLAGVFVLRLFVEEPGPLFLVPVILGAWWFGRWAGLGLGLIASALAVLAGEINPGGPDAGVVRLVSFWVVGYLIGLLAGQRRALRTRVDIQDTELDDLHRIQEALSPADIPARPALELGFIYVPADEGVAGDFCLVTRGPEAATTVIVLGDVAGKGLDAAQRASFVRTALATSAPYTDEPCRLLELGNAALVERSGTSETFVTALCVTYRPNDGSITWASAGHPPPVWLDDGRPLGGSGHVALPLGLDREIACRSHETQLGPGQGLLLFTDGLFEARSPERPSNFFGVERVSALLQEFHGARAVDLVERLRAAAAEFAGGRLPDDLCMLALRAEQ